MAIIHYGQCVSPQKVENVCPALLTTKLIHTTNIHFLRASPVFTNNPGL